MIISNETTIKSKDMAQSFAMKLNNLIASELDLWEALIPNPIIRYEAIIAVLDLMSEGISSDIRKIVRESTTAEELRGKMLSYLEENRS